MRNNLKYDVLAFIITSLLFFVPFSHLSGQSADDRLFIIKDAGLYIDSLASTKMEAISKKQFYPFSHYFKEIPQTLPINKNIWIKYRALNNKKTDTAVYFSPGHQQEIEAFSEIDGQIAFIGETGLLVPESQLNIAGSRLAIQIKLPSHTSTGIYLKVFNYTTYHVDPFVPKLYSKQELDVYTARSALSHSYHDIMFAFCFGMFIMMFFYILIKFIYIRDKAYLWYALYIFCMLAYFLLNYLQQPYHDYLFSEIPFLLHVISDPFIILQIVCYLFFIIEILDLKKTDILLYRILASLSAFLYVNIFIGILFVYITKDINAMIALNNFIGLFICMVGLFSVYRIYSLKTVLSRILLCGVACMIVFSIFSLMVEYVKAYLDISISIESMLNLDLLLIGNLLEILFFTLSLGYRDRLVQKEKLHFQTELVRQYEKTVSLQNKYRLELEIEVKQKTEQIVQNNKILEIERTDKIKSDFKRQIAELEMKALLAQMNPHFIFNCLSTIESYIYQYQQRKASKLLQKFAMLTRLILENSRLPFITVCRELEALTLYVQLEKERSGNRFNYSMNIDDNAASLLISPMLVQPLVENAILHGLRPLPGIQGMLKIIVRKENEVLHFSVEDNGIGLECSRKLKENEGFCKSSVGIDIVKQRLALVCNDRETNTCLKITDKAQPDRGVLAEIFFPVLTNN